MVIVPSPSLSKSENASLNSEDKAETSYGYDNLLEQSSYYTVRIHWINSFEFVYGANDDKPTGIQRR